MDLLTVSLSGVAGLVIGILAMVAYSKAGLNKDQQKAEQLLKKAETEAEAKVKQAVLDGKTQAHDLRVEAEKEIKERKQEAMDLENKLLRREDNLNFRDEALTQKERQVSEKMQKAADKLSSLEAKEKKLQEEIDKQIEVLENVAKMSSQDAKAELFSVVEKKMEHETIAYIKDKEEFLSVFKNYLEKPFPAVSFVGVNDLDNGAMIAVEGQGINTLRHEQAHKNSSCSHGCSGCDGSCG